jgi:hypothetical protein
VSVSYFFLSFPLGRKMAVILMPTGSVLYLPLYIGFSMSLTLYTVSLCHFCVPPVLALGPDLVPELVAGEVRVALPKILIGRSTYSIIILLLC